MWGINTNRSSRAHYKNVNASMMMEPVERPSASAHLLSSGEIRDHLRNVLASKTFAATSRLPRFLQYVVETATDGEVDRLKETTIGVVVFDRHPSYDPKIDPIVRNTARRLRAKLEQYYLEEGAHDPIRIVLSKGGYAPTFELAGNGGTEIVSASPVAVLPALEPPLEAVAPAPAETTVSRRRIVIGLSAASALIAGSAFALWRFPGRVGQSAQIKPLTSYPGQALQASISPDSQHIAYVWDANASHYDIYLKALAGQPERVTSGPGHSLHPCWSPDGTMLAFLRVLPDLLQVVILPLRGGGEKSVIRIEGLYYGLWEPAAAQILGSPGPVWSPDGRFLTYTNGTPGKPGRPLHLFSIASGESRSITNPPDGDHDFYPAFSPDGNRIAFARYRTRLSADVFVARTAGGEATPVTSERRDIRGLTWTPDGRSIVFSSNRSGAYGLWKVKASGGEPALIPTSGRSATDPAIARSGWLAYTDSNVSVSLWRVPMRGGPQEPRKFSPSSRQTNGARYSPAGSRVAFVSDRSGHWELWVSDADGSAATQITDFRGPWVGAPQWSPDGRMIAFDGRPDGHSAVFVVDAAGGTPKKLERNRFESKMPSWSRDGKWIYFASNRTGTLQIWKVSQTGGDPKFVCGHTGLYPIESFDGTTLFFLTQKPGIWRMRLDGGEPEVLPGLEKVLPNDAWEVTANGIYLIDEAGRRDAILFYRFGGRRAEAVSTLPAPVVSANPGLTISPDGNWAIYTHQAETQSDLISLTGWQATME